ncbi:MAG: antibiotic biosynthesis monooxygenase family protein [Nitrospirota bacterium]
MSTITITLRILQGKKKEFLQTVRALHEDMKREKGFMKFTIFQEVNDPDVFHLTEEWNTSDNLEMFTKSETFSVLLGALKVLCKETEIRYQIGDARKDTKVLKL